MPTADADDEHRDDKNQRVDESGNEIRVGEKGGVVRKPDEADVVRIEQAVMKQGKIERHHERHDHPNEEDDHRG